MTTSSSSIQIVSLTDCQEHIPALATLWYENISKEWVPNASCARNEAQLLEHLNTDALPLTLVALKDGKAVGMASLRANDGLDSDFSPWLGSLVVDPLARMQGIGQQLIDAIKQKAQLLGFKTLYLLAFDKTIPSWYETLGWQSIGSDSLFSHPVTLMHNQLR